MILGVINKRDLLKLIMISVLVGILCSILGDVLKMITENGEATLFSISQDSWIYVFTFPFIGLSTIYLLRQFFFGKNENKGIKEIFELLKIRKKDLPLYKIPSHFFNGILTVVFGGSTGIEVPAVVASSTLAAETGKLSGIYRRYKREIIGASVAAAVAILFNSPIAGILFAVEVILKKISKRIFMCVLISVFTVWCFGQIIYSKPLLAIKVSYWNHSVFPYFILLGVLSGLNSVYLTKCVLFFQSMFSTINNHFLKLIGGSLLISCCLFIFPQLYGDGYHAMNTIFHNADTLMTSKGFILVILGILILKPIVTSATLASGGDGGVFAPSLFIGAFLGFFLAFVLNNFFQVQVIPTNFMLVGMAAVLSASLHAPFTAAFLICEIIGDYTLIVPVLAASLIAKLIAKMVIPYTVYSYRAQKKV